MTDTTPGETRRWFGDAADGWADLVTRVTEADLDRPALGEWTVRDLIGHTTRAFTTIETYLADPPGPDAVWLPSAAAYFRTALAGADHGEVAARGREAGVALGADPVAEAIGRARAVVELVEGTPDSAPLMTRFGAMLLVDYLPTRAFELTVHGLDLARALGRAPTDGLRRSAPAALALAAALASEDAAAAALLALTGRGLLPKGFSVL